MSLSYSGFKAFLVCSVQGYFPCLRAKFSEPGARLWLWGLGRRVLGGRVCEAA